MNLIYEANRFSKISIASLVPKETQFYSVSWQYCFDHHPFVFMFVLFDLTDACFGEFNFTILGH